MASLMTWSGIALYLYIRRRLPLTRHTERAVQPSEHVPHRCGRHGSNPRLPFRGLHGASPPSICTWPSPGRQDHVTSSVREPTLRPGVEARLLLTGSTISTVALMNAGCWRCRRCWRPTPPHAWYCTNCIQVYEFMRVLLLGASAPSAFLPFCPFAFLPFRQALSSVRVLWCHMSAQNPHSGRTRVQDAGGAGVDARLRLLDRALHGGATVRQRR